MSDIHGEVDRFHAMLSLISFSEEDTLYILGDVIDRKPGGVAVLQEIMDTPNMVMLLGNHEHMCLETLGPDTFPGAKERWFRNGGDITCNDLFNMCSADERQRILDYIAQLPACLETEVNGQAFHLVHAFPGSTVRDQIWERPTADAKRPFPDKTTIIGHTPTCKLTDQPDAPYRIWHGDGIINIDCGCARTTPLRRLACLRLDDLAEFYI